MKPNNAGKNMWLRAETENQNQKQNAQTLDADGMKTFSTVYVTQLEATSQI